MTRTTPAFKEKLGIALAPDWTTGQHSSYGSSGYWLVSEKSRHKQEAWELIKHLVAPDNMKQYVEGVGLLPARTDVKAYADNPLMQVWIDQVKYYGPLPQWPFSEWDITLKEMQAAFAGQKPAQQALADAEKQVNDKLKDMGLYK